MIYKDPADSSQHSITLKTLAEGGDFDPASLYEPASGRQGYVAACCQSPRGLGSGQGQVHIWEVFGLSGKQDRTRIIMKDLSSVQKTEHKLI